jgi:hypothetical protein
VDRQAIRSSAEREESLRAELAGLRQEVEQRDAGFYSNVLKLEKENDELRVQVSAMTIELCNAGKRESAFQAALEKADMKSKSFTDDMVCSETQTTDDLSVDGKADSQPVGSIALISELIEMKTKYALLADAYERATFWQEGVEKYSIPK